MNAAQFQEIRQLLTDIRDQLAAPAGPKAPAGTQPQDFVMREAAYIRKLAVPMREETPSRPAQRPADGPAVESLALGHRQALKSLLNVLDDWIIGARHNHKAMGHRAEPVGSECWRSFHPADIRTMVNDAARDLGLQTFPLPADPVENQR